MVCFSCVFLIGNNIWIVIVFCLGGRNRKVSEAFVKTGKSIKDLETEMLNGQKLQGPITAEEVNFMLKNKNMQEKYVNCIEKIVFFFLT